MENVEHQPLQSRFVLTSDGGQAVLQYRLFKDEDSNVTVVDFNSTFVPPEFRGKGLAEKLVRAGLKWATGQGYKLHASCWYAAKFIR